jgi:hypothetical protein
MEPELPCGLSPLIGFQCPHDYAGGPLKSGILLFVLIHQRWVLFTL